MLQLSRLLGQIPGADEAVKAATKDGWVAAALVVIMLAICALAGYLIKRILEDSAAREKRMSDRIDKLEAYIQDVLKSTLEKTTKALEDSTSVIQSLVSVIDKLSGDLNDRPCFWSADKQAEVVEKIVRRVSKAT